MYRVTLYNGSETTIIHEPSVNPRDPHLFTCTLTQGSSGEIDTLQFDILPNNPGYDQMFSRSTLVTVADLNTTPEKNEFIGRVLTITPQMEESGMVYKTVVCEDRLGYLCDSIQPYIAEDTYTVEDFFTLLLENHNSQVEDYKKIYPGTISVTTSSGNVTKGLNYQTTWDALRDKLLNSIGGEIQLYSGTDGLLYLDYVTELGTRDSQTIEIGKNMRSITQSIDPTTVITRLIPLGAKPEITEENPNVDPEDRLTIASVNDGKIYLDDEDAQAVYGIVEGVEYWDDVTLPGNLLERGQEWLKNQTIIDSVSLSALDLSLIGLEADSIQRYNYYRTINPAIGLDSYLRVVKRTVDVVEPENINFEMGAQAKSLASTLTDASNRASSAAGDAEAAINAELSKTVAVLIASNAQITELETKVAYIESAYIDRIEAEEIISEYIYAAIGEFGFLTVDEANILYASIGDLDAVAANITDLTAFAENVYVLLGGTGSFGELDTIHLTSDNAVIDEAVIVTALMDTVLASVLTAGVIYTDYIKIANNEGKQLWIDGSTIQLTDNNEIVRVQIGEDGTGDYNLYLWNADGDLIWDAQGLCEAGLPVGDDAIIKDAAVADDANISGYKLNIDEICTIINSDGSYQIDAASVTINGETLDAWYVTVQDWGDTTVILQTQLTEIQGLIDAKVWETDIQNALDPIYGDISSLTDNYAEIRVEVDNISSEVASVTTTEAEHYIEMSGQITEINETIDGITTQVSSFNESIEQLGTSIDDIESQLANQEGLKQLIPYFCIWDSGTESPPDNEDLTPAICGEAICGTTICGVTDGLLWTTVEPVPDEDQYKWIKWLQVFEDGTETWSTAYCLTDIYARSAIVSNYETLYTLIEQNNDSVNITISQALGTIYETQDGILSTLDAYNTYFTFDLDGLHISKSNSPFAVVLGSERLSFTENDSEIAYISNSMLYIHDAEVITSLKIGGFRWEIGSTGNLNLVKVSEKDVDNNEEPDKNDPDDGGDDG